MVHEPEQRVWANFEEFVSLRGAALWRSAWLLTGDRQRAEDLVQDALSRCWTKFDRLNNDEDSFEAYVRTSIYHAHLAWWRRGSWREAPRETTPERTSAADQHADGDLARALLDLPRQQRAVIVLRYFDDLTEVQTAETLRISVGAVKQHAHRAIIALRNSPHLADADRAALPPLPTDRPQGKD
ncbi:SigE family RNA polymerase sigma factor [Aestuariimicrobium ganziense]|uniref:SigE family RNA polymerase sigma factor n=1 Tax=Aestuariimicrobium ganziense TaxID=2773677 RepID=UPI001940ADE0|nr:SigE family RNA polymerase sigma factor [Aestuariimicrobium ganziense]